MLDDSHTTNQNTQLIQNQQPQTYPQQVINQLNQHSYIENTNQVNLSTKYPKKQNNINNNAINQFPKQKASKLNK